ncbi:MAG: reprolysin-like metallopeptidase [Bacteroidota bacterium]
MLRRFFVLLPLITSFAFAQSPGWTVSPSEPTAVPDLVNAPHTFTTFATNAEQWRTYLGQAPQDYPEAQRRAPFTVDLPDAEGNLHQFRIWRSTTLHPDLAAKYPQILSFTGQGIDNPRTLLKLDFNPTGLHAMVFSPRNDWAIEPMYRGDNAYYLGYRKTSLTPDEREFSCGVTNSLPPAATQRTESSSTNPTGTDLRNYRLALGLTGEYSTFHGGTKAGALAAAVVTMNRVNGIYERDFTVTMTLVPNTDTLIYLNPNTDPYTNNNLGAMLGENQDLCDSLIGVPNYDIGHVFGTAGGGLAGLGVVCGGGKAFGGTGLNVPTGDFFDVDYVSHEFGHQFGGNHTFNECGSQGPQPYEPGSGVTIMAYAGLCGTSNLQTTSIDQFHVATYDEVIAYSQNSQGNTCPLTTPTNNDPPVVTVPDGGFYIPFQTPFELTGSALDAQMDSLTYSWEQFDRGPSVHPDSAVGTAPLFRPWPANNSPTRIFPQIDDLVTNTSTIGELLPQFGREMNFRCVVRDNNPAGGGVDYAQITFQVADSAGPFSVLSPNGGQIWVGGTIETVTWDVANSDLAPVNCQSVDIYLSQDGGYTYPILLAANRLNNGAAAITVPNLNGTDFRIKVKGSDNIFFDISNQDFTITPAPNPDFTVTVPQPLRTICGADSAVYTIQLDTLMNFSGNVSLSLVGNPAGTTFSFDVNPSPTPGTVQLTVAATSSANPGNYTMTLQANGTTGIKSLPLQLNLRAGPPAAVSLTSPFNGATNVSGAAPLVWNPLPFVQSYLIEIAENPAFSPLVVGASVIGSNTYLPSPSLNPNTVYYWRVRADQSDCGPGPWSPLYSFQTELTQCAIYTSIDTPVVISGSGTPTVYSELPVTQSMVLTDVNVLNLRGVHTWISDLNFTLISPSNDSIFLFGGICGDQDDFDLSFDDAATSGNIPCPPTTGLTYLPADPLGTFNGGNAQGVWRMKVFDAVNQDGGQLQNWSLELCGPPINPNAPTVTINPLPVNPGATGVVSPFLLNTNCGTSSATTVIYTLTSLPAHGDLLLNGTPLVVGDTFSQDQINNGQLTYAHNLAAFFATDQFGFTVTCLNGGYVGGLTFPIDILLISGVGAPESDALELAPNPAGNAFQLRYRGPIEVEKEVWIIDAVGRTVLRAPMPDADWEGSVAHLPSGLYTVQVRSQGIRLGTVKLVIVH